MSDAHPERRLVAFGDDNREVFPEVNRQTLQALFVGFGVVAAEEHGVGAELADDDLRPVRREVNHSILHARIGAGGVRLQEVRKPHRLVCGTQVLQQLSEGWPAGLHQALVPINREQGFDAESVVGLLNQIDSVHEASP